MNSLKRKHFLVTGTMELGDLAVKKFPMGLLGTNQSNNNESHPLF